jgi:fumarate hydratase subunit beta
VSRQLSLPLSEQDIQSLHAADEVELSGEVLTGRDQACARLYNLIQASKPLPIDLKGRLIYFVGPTPARPGEVIGSAGPTTSGRMDRFLPAMIGAGLSGAIGKGLLSQNVKEAFVKHHGVYFGAIGGTGALLSQSITGVCIVAFEELLSEAIHVMQLQRFPLVVLNDCHGGDLYKQPLRGAEQI